VQTDGRKVVAVISGGNISDADHQAALLRSRMASQLAYAEGV